ncbi:MAG: hypothetical protein OXG04_24490 [Acidobacteria bacterium]|nr:hypothetical protein [Acidobacteriota bacterium]
MQKTRRGHRPRLTIVIGTNGAGESTWCSKHEDELPAAFYDADSIANSLGDWNDRHNQSLNSGRPRRRATDSESGIWYLVSNIRPADDVML